MVRASKSILRSCGPVQDVESSVLLENSRVQYATLEWEPTLSYAPDAIIGHIRDIVESPEASSQSVTLYAESA